MAGRLLQRLEQGVERLRGQHVDLVDDVDLIGAAHRGEVDGVDNLLADAVDARAACGVQLVDIRVRALGDGLALRAGAIRHAAMVALGLLTQQRLGQDARHGGLARSTRTAEQVRMRQAPLRDGVLQRGHNMLLAHYALKRQRTIFSVERLHGSSPPYNMLKQRRVCARG